MGSPKPNVTILDASDDCLQSVKTPEKPALSENFAQSLKFHTRKLRWNRYRFQRAEHWHLCPLFTSSD